MNVNELKAEIVRNDYTVEKLADSINMGRTTLWRRFKNPEDFTLKEIKDIGLTLKLSNERIEQIFFRN